MKLRITVHGVAYEVDVEVLDPGEGFAVPTPVPQQVQHTNSGAAAPPPPNPNHNFPTPPAGGTADVAGHLTSPIAGTVVELKTKAGDTVKEGDILLVIEAMKMNTSIAAPGSGKIKKVAVAAGDTVREGQLLVEFE